MTEPDINSVPQTPALIYSERRLRHQASILFDGLRGAFSGHVEAYFAVKSCYCRPVLRVIRSIGFGAEVMSELEFDLASSCDIQGSQIMVNGLGRPLELFVKAIRSQSTIILDSEGDSAKLRRALDHIGGAARVGIRIALDMRSVPSSPYASSSHKLGLRMGSRELNSVLDYCEADQRVTLSVLHAHFSINERARDTYEHGLRQLADIAARIEEQYHRIHFEGIDIGGGFATYDSSEDPLARSFFHEIGLLAEKYFAGRSLLLEPGRYISNPSGYVVATVTDVKRVEDRWVVVTDATTNVLVPVSSRRHILLDPQPTLGGRYEIAVVDGITSPDNVVIPALRLACLPEVGQRILLGNCGAYTDVLAHVWAFQPFPVYFVDGNNTTSVVRSAAVVAKCSSLFLGLDDRE